MKVFYPLQVFYPSQAGGPANTVYWITKNLKKRGFEPIVISTDYGISNNFLFDKWHETEAGRVIYIKTKIQNFPLIQTVVSLYHFKKAHVIHLSSVFFPACFITAFASRIFNKKMVISPRGELDPEALKFSSTRKRPILWLIRKFINNYPVFHSTCDEETVYIRNIFGSEAKVIQIPNFIEIPHQKHRKPSKYILYIGRIHPKKALDNLIHGLSLSKEFLNSDFVLKIAGTGKNEYLNQIKNLIQELRLHNKVELVGQVEGADKQQLYADAYFTIMPSHTENFGVVVLESLAQSTPVIASRGTPWSKLEEEKVGFWVENSPEKITEIIDEILQMDPVEYENYRSRSRDFVEKNFDISRNIEKWISFYESL